MIRIKSRWFGSGVLLGHPVHCVGWSI